MIDCDAWDGYPVRKHELLSHVKEQGIHNVVAISGDMHAFQCGIVRDDPDPAKGTPVIVDFVCAGISSTFFYTYMKAASSAPWPPQIRARCRRSRCLVTMGVQAGRRLLLRRKKST